MTERPAVAPLRRARPTWPRSRPCRWRTAACRRRRTRCSPGPPTLWPDRTALTVLPGRRPLDASRCGAPSPSCWPTCTATRTCCTGSACAAATRSPCWRPTAPSSITATLAAQLAGIAAPINGGLSRRAHRRAAAPLRRPGARRRRPRARAGRLGAARASSPARPGSTRSSCCGPTGPRAAPRAAARRSTACASATSASWPPSSRHDRLRRRRRRGPTDLAALFHTGGTTGRAEAGRAHPRQRGRRRLDDRRQLAARRRLGGVRRAAAVPRQRAGGHAAGAAVQGPAGGVGRAARLPRTGAVRRVLEDRRALPDRRDERRADRLRRPRAGRRWTPTSAACGSPSSAPRRCPPRSGTPSRRTPGCAWSRGTG